jgi:hypothetical protein
VTAASPTLLELYHWELAGDPSSTVDAPPDLLSDGDGDSAGEGWEGGHVGSCRSPPDLTDSADGDDCCSDGQPGLTNDDRSHDDDGDGDWPPGLTDDDRWNDSDSEDEPFGGRVGPPVEWRLDLDLPHMSGAGVWRTDFVLLPLGSGYEGQDEVLSSHAARWRAGVTALFPVDVESDGGSTLDFDVDAGTVW